MVWRNTERKEGSVRTHGCVVTTVLMQGSVGVGLCRVQECGTAVVPRGLCGSSSWPTECTLWLGRFDICWREGRASISRCAVGWGYANANNARMGEEEGGTVCPDLRTY